MDTKSCLKPLLLVSLLVALSQSYPLSDKEHEAESSKGALTQALRDLDSKISEVLLRLNPLTKSKATDHQADDAGTAAAAELPEMQLRRRPGPDFPEFNAETRDLYEEKGADSAGNPPDDSENKDQKGYVKRLLAALLQLAKKDNTH